MEGSAVVDMEGETTSGKPLAECAVGDCMEGAAVVDMEGEPHQVNHWQNLQWRRVWREK